MKKPITKTSPESVFMVNKRLKTFYTTKKDRHVTAISTYYKVKIKTIRMIVINPHNGKTERITKIIKV